MNKDRSLEVHEVQPVGATVTKLWGWKIASEPPSSHSVKQRGNKRKIVFTSSTCSVVNGPPYLDFPRSILEGIFSSQYVRALRLMGALCLAANLRTR